MRGRPHHPCGEEGLGPPWASSLHCGEEFTNPVVRGACFGESLASQRCPGCQTEPPSQLQAGCLSLLTEDRLRLPVFALSLALMPRVRASQLLGCGVETSNAPPPPATAPFTKNNSTLTSCRLATAGHHQLWNVASPIRGAHCDVMEGEGSKLQNSISDQWPVLETEGGQEGERHRGGMRSRGEGGKEAENERKPLLGCLYI